MLYKNLHNKCIWVVETIRQRLKKQHKDILKASSSMISFLSSALYCIRQSVFFKRAETTFEDKTKLFHAYRKLISYDWIQQETKKFILKPDLKWYGNSWHELLVEKCFKYIKWKGISPAKENVHSSFVDTT